MLYQQRNDFVDFVLQRLRGQKQKQKFRHLEKREYLHNQGRDLKTKGTIRKPIKFSFRQSFDDLFVI